MYSNLYHSPMRAAALKFETATAMLCCHDRMAHTFHKRRWTTRSHEHVVCLQF